MSEAVAAVEVLSGVARTRALSEHASLCFSERDLFGYVRDAAVVTSLDLRECDSCVSGGGRGSMEEEEGGRRRKRRKGGERGGIRRRGGGCKRLAASTKRPPFYFIPRPKSFLLLGSSLPGEA